MDRGHAGLAGLAVVALLLPGPALTGCASQIGTPATRPSAPATPRPDDAGTGDPTNYAVGEQLEQVVAAIERGEEDEDIPGLAGIEVDDETASVTVYWVGEPPEHVRQVAAAPPTGVTADLRPATYDLRAMLAAIDAVFTRYEDELHGASPTSDGTGIVVEWTADAAATGPTPEELAEVAGMPVITEISEPPEAVDG